MERRLSPGSLGAGWWEGRVRGKGPGPEGEARDAQEAYGTLGRGSRSQD